MFVTRLFNTPLKVFITLITLFLMFGVPWLDIDKTSELGTALNVFSAMAWIVFAFAAGIWLYALLRKLQSNQSD